MKQTDKEANETGTRIYQSLWKNMLWGILGLAFAMGGFLIIRDESCDLSKKVLGGWLGVIFFGGGGLFLIILTLYNRIRHIPLLIIYEDRLGLYEQRKGTYHTIRFADVKSFRLIKVCSSKQIAVDYKATPLTHKLNESSSFMRSLMTFSFYATGAIESIPVDNLTMKGKEICDMLNERLNESI